VVTSLTVKIPNCMTAPWGVRWLRLPQRVRSGKYFKSEGAALRRGSQEGRPDLSDNVRSLSAPAKRI
jgi:hypothetical protein